MMPSMEPLHISEGELAKDMRSILQRVEAGTEVIIERDAHPGCHPPGRTGTPQDLRVHRANASRLRGNHRSRLCE